MAVLVWDDAGKRFYETGVDHGVLYPMDNNGAYPTGYAWNGLISVTESPSGAEANPLYADNIKYLNLISMEQFGGTIEAYTYPDQFAECDGSASPLTGMLVGQQTRKTFGLVFRTVLGNDVAGQDLGYKLHLLYGLTAAPSEKAYASINESPEAISFSWEFNSIPAVMTSYKPVSLIIVDSTKANAGKLAALEDELFGTALITAHLPLPDAVKTLLTP